MMHLVCLIKQIKLKFVYSCQVWYYCVYTKTKTCMNLICTIPVDIAELSKWMHYCSSWKILNYSLFSVSFLQSNYCYILKANTLSRAGWGEWCVCIHTMLTSQTGFMFMFHVWLVLSYLNTFFSRCCVQKMYSDFCFPMTFNTIEFTF